MGFRIVAPLFAVSLALAACESHGVAAASTDMGTKENSPTPAVACPSEEFPTFLDAFMSSIEVQKTFTASPLQIDTLDANAEPEPKVISTMSAEITFPVMPDRKKQSEEGLTLSVERPAAKPIVKLERPDTDYQVLYHFRKEGCWMLYRKEDKSI